MSKIIGIDLGTGNSCCYVMEGKDAKCITNPNGGRTTPSVINITDKEILVGESAKRQAVMSPENTIFAVKRLIGRKYKDKEVQDWKKIAPYKIVESPNGDACVEVNGKVYSPTELSSFILAQLKKDAEAYLGEKVEKCVVTCPAAFNSSQKKCTQDAAKVSGMECVRIINEPTASSLCYQKDAKNVCEKIIICDIGSGTTDYSILEIDDGVIEIYGSEGDSYAGGSDFDKVITDWLVSEFKEETGIDLSQDKMALQRLKDASETAKIELSTMMETQINLPFITADATGPKHLIKTLTRSKFEQMSSHITEKIIAPIPTLLNDVKLSVSDISDVILVGGCTRVNSVYEAIKNFFGKEPSKTVNPDEAVAIGAARMGQILSKDNTEKDILLLDVTSLDLGIEVQGSLSHTIIERNTTIPCSKNELFTNAQKGQKAVTIRCCQGPRKMFNDNLFIGQFDLDIENPEQYDRGEAKIRVTMTLDANSILSVEALDENSGKKKNITFNYNSGLSDEEIERLTKEAEAHKKDDEEKAELIEVKNQASGVIYNIEKTMSELGDKVSSEEKKEIESNINTLKTVMEGTDKEEIKKSIDILLQSSYKLSEKLYNQTNSSNDSGFTQQKNPNDDVMDADFTEV